MTLKYSASIPTGTNYFKFISLLLRWKGSVYKLVWKDVVMYLVLYYTINLVYRLALVDDRKTRFEDFVVFMASWKSKSLPITFMLGFFVSQILWRWWRMFDCIPTMNSPAFNLNALIMTQADPALARRVRLTAMRYLNLAWILAMRSLSTLIKKRFKLSKEKLEALACDPVERVAAELELLNQDEELKKHFPKMITKSEIATFQEIASRSESPESYKPEWWVPLQWCSRLLKKATMLGFVENERNYLGLVCIVDSFEEKLHDLVIYAQFNLPLVYSQVVIIGVYSYFVMHIFDNQFLVESRAADRKLGTAYLFDYYVPVFGLLELIFFMGWLKVALVLLNPLGSDDEDFPTSDLLNYNIQLSRYLAGNYSLVFPPKLRERRCRDTTIDLNLKASLAMLESEDDEIDDDLRVHAGKGGGCGSKEAAGTAVVADGAGNGGFEQPPPSASGDFAHFVVDNSSFSYTANA